MLGYPVPECNSLNIKRWDVPRMHVRRGVLLLGSSASGNSSYSSVTDGCWHLPPRISVGELEAKVGIVSV